MKELILTKKEAIEQYGNEAQKNHFKKYKKIKSRDVEDALIKTLKQYYESVDTVKDGRSNVYKLGDKLDYVAKREDGRANNGNTIELPYSNELNTLTIDYIVKNCKDEMKQFSINTWLNAIGLVDREFTSAAFNNRVKRNIMDNLVETYNNKFTKKDIVLLDNFIQNERDRLTRNLKGLFNRLHKNKLINLRVTMFACDLNDNHYELSKDEESEVVILKRELREKHNVKPRELMFKLNDSKVIEYMKEEKKELMKIGYKFTYTAYGIILNVKEKEIESYLTKLKDSGKLEFEIGLTEEMANMTLNYFKDEYGKRATQYAEGRQDESNKYDNSRIRILKKARKYLPMYELLLIYFKLSRKNKNEVSFKNSLETFGYIPF